MAGHKKRAVRVPKMDETRRLTREEAARIGVSYGAKHRVRSSIKRVTKKTAHYAESKVIKSTYGMSKAERALEHRTTTFATGGQGKKGSKHIKGLSRSQLRGLIKKAAKDNKTVQIQANGFPKKSGARYSASDATWVTSAMLFADEAVDDDFLDGVLDNMGFDMEPNEEDEQPENPPSSFGLIVYER